MSSPKPAARGDLAPLVLDRLELVQADLVDLARVHLEGRPAPDRRPVDRLAVGRRPDAGLLATGVPVLATQRLEEGRVGGIDDVADDLADALAVGVGRALHAGRDDRLVDRDLEHALDLGDRPLGHDRRRRQPGAERLAQDVGVGGHERGIGVQPRDERLEPLGRVDRLELRQLGQQLLGTAHLVDDAELVQALVVLLDPQLADHLEHVAGDALLRREPVDRDGRRLGRRARHQLADLRATGRRRVLEPVGVPFVAVERGGRRIELEDALPEAVGQGVHGGTVVGHRGSRGLPAGGTSRPDPSRAARIPGLRPDGAVA